MKQDRDGFPLRMMVVGHGRHGKDTVAEILRDQFGATFVSSSWFMAERVVFPRFCRTQPGRYATAQACYDVSIWIDAGERLEYREPRSSLTIEPWMRDFVIDNNGSTVDLGRNIASLMGTLCAS